VTGILVPYHLDEHLTDLDLPAGADTTITVDLPPGEPRGDAGWARLGLIYGAVADAVGHAAGAGGRPMVLSGDCTTAIGTVAGLQRAGLDPAVIWLDAHGDLQTMETTASGYLGGMPLRILVGYRPELVADAVGLRAVPEERAVLVGARDLDPPEVDYLATAALRCREVADLSEEDLPDGPIYLHVDADVVDGAELPGLRFAATGGPGLSTVSAALRRVLATGRVVALGMCCTWYGGHGAAERFRPHLEEAVAAWR
jgi:arginase